MIPCQSWSFWPIYCSSPTVSSHFIHSFIGDWRLCFVGRITFDKMTNRDYSGTIYYTIRNVSLYECLGWCRDEDDCTAAAFSFVVNPLTPIQETTCLLQNETLAKKPVSVSGNNNNNNLQSSGSYSSTSLQKAVNMYFFTKMQLRSDNLCNRLWSFERFPNKMMRGLDNAIIYTSNREACLSACLSEVQYHFHSFPFIFIDWLIGDFSMIIRVVLFAVR